jgi:hypothetical protein
MYAFAMFAKSVLPGSPVVMCHQSTVTGAPAAADGDSPAVLGASVAAVDGAADGAADGAVVAVEPPQAAAKIETAATAPAIRQRIDTIGPPPRHQARARGPFVLHESFGPRPAKFRGAL